MNEQISDASNTLIPAFLALKSKGYRVRWERVQSAADSEIWYAEGANGRYIADGPVQLLGLIAMRELRGANWKANDSEIDDFLQDYEA